MSDTGALQLHTESELGEAPVLIAFEGWNDAGEAATTAIRYIADAIDCEPLGQIDCEGFFDFTVRRPTVRIDEDDRRIIEWPTTRFSHGRLDASRAIVIGDGVEPHMNWRRFGDLIAEQVQRFGTRRVVMLGAFLADVVYSRPVAVSGFASPARLLDDLDVTQSSYEGPTGIVGVLAERLYADGVEVVNLWAGLPHYISSSPNPRGALALVETVSRYLDIKVDLSMLQDDAHDFEERISELVASDPELNEYVRELKRREFAQ